MARVEKVVEFWVQLKKRVGSLADALSVLSDAGLSGRALVAWEEKKRGVLLLVTNNPRKTEGALKRAKPKLRYKKNPALAVTLKNRRGSVRRVAQALADADINITGAYASAMGTGNYLLILGTENNNRAMKIIKAL
jgi:hypothetical protein